MHNGKLTKLEKVFGLEEMKALALHNIANSKAQWLATKKVAFLQSLKNFIGHAMEDGYTDVLEALVSRGVITENYAFCEVGDVRRLTPAEVRAYGCNPTDVDFEAMERAHRLHIIVSRGIKDPDNPRRLADPDDPDVIAKIAGMDREELGA
jgi:hypothetical protein